MTKLIAWGLVAVAALCVTSIAWAGSPTSQDVKPYGAILEARIVGSLAGAAVDTAYLDLSKARWTGDSSAADEVLSLAIAQIDSDPDSILISAKAMVHADVIGAESYASAQYDGQVQINGQLSVFSRFLMVIITNDSADSTDTYDVRIQVPAR